MHQAHRSLWVLTAITILTAGTVAQTLAAPAGALTDVLLMTAVLVLAISSTLLVRVLRHLTRSAPSHPNLPAVEEEAQS